MESLQPSRKINVFISSKCDKQGGTPKYNPIRAELKQLIEKTNLANVYTFESEPASTLSAASHYTYALEDSDVCIFLIDNADGIPKGVQSEINTVMNNKIMAIYYFCDENTTAQTTLEKSLMGATYAKSRTVHHFSDLSKDSAKALIDDITLIYHNYCTHRLLEQNQEDVLSKEIEVQSPNEHHEVSFPKVILKNIDKSVEYVLKVTADYQVFHYPDYKVQTSDLDDWGVQFLGVLFEGKSIKCFNANLFLDTLKKMQSPEYYNVVALRWKAIQFYFSGDIKSCIYSLKKALDLARNKKQALWIINDILIDLRNQHWVLSFETHTISEPEAQLILDQNTEELYYPIMDRINETLNNEYINGLYKKKTESPFTVELGGNLTQLGKLLTSTFIIALYNGSLTHILLFYKKVRDFLFYLSSRYSDWIFKRNLFKYTIYEGNKKETKGIVDSFPELLRNLSANDAESIMSFCATQPIEYKRQSLMLLAFGSVGYYLDNSSFEKYEKEIVEGIERWLTDEKAVVSIGDYIFESLSNVSYRMSQDTLSEICCLFMDKHFSRWYLDMFRFMAKRININKMKEKNAQSLISHIIEVLKDKENSSSVQYNVSFLSTLRRQNSVLTEELDKQISETLPSYYNFDYKLETTNNKEKDYPYFVDELIKKVKNSNDTQGKNGAYYGYGTRDIARISAILQNSDFSYSANQMDNLINTVSYTLIESKESVSTKIDAIRLLCCIAIKYPEDFSRNMPIYKNIVNNEEKICVASGPALFSNIDTLALRIGIKILMLTIGADIYVDMIELLPLITNDTATAITVTGLLADYLDMNKTVLIPVKTEMVLLYNTFEWLQEDSTDIRWNATRILLTMLKNEDNADIINRKIISLLESDNVYIKNLILRILHKSPIVSEEIKARAFAICENDKNYVTRYLCKKLTSEES